MIEQRREAEPASTVVALAQQLLQVSEQYALAGALNEAVELLLQVWSLAEGRDAVLANTAAWESAWLWLRIGDQDRATSWFDRVSALPRTDSRLWPMAREALLELCALMKKTKPEPSAGQASTMSACDPALVPLAFVNLGRFEIRRAGTLLPVCKARKPITLLRYLLTRPGHVADKEEVMELLWPGASPRAAVHSMHVAISTLRGYLDLDRGSYILYEASRYRINPAASIVDDCASFAQHYSEGERYRRAGDWIRAEHAYSAALDLYGGDYYVHSNDPEWVLAERERQLARYLTTLDHLGHIFMLQRRWEAAITSYERLVERDAYRDDAQGRLMHCYAQLGRRGAALRQYERYAAILASDFGLDPAPEIQALYREIVGTPGARGTANKW